MLALECVTQPYLLLPVRSSSEHFRLLARSMPRRKYVADRFVTNIKQQCRVEEHTEEWKKPDSLVVCWTERKYENVMFELKWDVSKTLSLRKQNF